MQDPISLIQRADAIAAELHAGQTRKGTAIPYIEHPREVMRLVRDHGGSEVEQAAALCHDTAEDAGGEAVLERLRRELGIDVAAIVAGCSDSLLPHGATKAPWRERKEAYLAHVRGAPRSVLVVSCADKLANARAILADLRDPAVGPAVWSRFSAGPADQLWYYGSLAAIFAERLPGPLTAELLAVVAAIEEERRGT